MNNLKIIGFREKNEIIAEIDELAEAQGINRSGFLRQIVREKLRRPEASPR